MIRNLTRGTLGRNHQMALVTGGVLDLAGVVKGGFACLTVSAPWAKMQMSKC